MTDSVASDFAPALAASKQTTVAVSVSSSSSAWQTGDYKMSAQAADHADPTGGSWLLCDSSAIDSAFAALIALVGASRPDARGRMLVMKGTNADVSTLLANDGQAVANRRPKHRTSLTDPGHAHGNSSGRNFMDDLGVGGNYNWTGGGQGGKTSATASSGTGVTVGTNNGNDALDTPSYLVPGNLFIHT